MRKLLESDNESSKEPVASPASLWLGKILGFLGSAVILWILIQVLAPTLVTAWAISWIDKLWVRLGIVIVAAAGFAALLSRIEGTIWAKYYVIIGYLLSTLLIIWIILHLLRYV